MAIGEVGGNVHTTILTCKATDEEPSIAMHDAVTLTGAANYGVTNRACGGEPVFGQARGGTNRTDGAIPVIVRGVLLLDCVGPACVDGRTGVVMADCGHPGRVRMCGVEGGGTGVIVGVSADGTLVHVLI